MWISPRARRVTGAVTVGPTRPRHRWHMPVWRPAFPAFARNACYIELMTQSSIDQGAPSVVVNKPRGRPFVKGQPRPQGSGRKRGTQGRVVTELREFFRECLNNEGFRDKVRARFESGAVLDSPHLLATITAHAIGKPVPQQPAEESRPPLLFISLADPVTGLARRLGEVDPLKDKVEMFGS